MKKQTLYSEIEKELDSVREQPLTDRNVILNQAKTTEEIVNKKLLPKLHHALKTSKNINEGTKTTVGLSYLYQKE